MMKNLGWRLENLREERDFSQKDMSSMLNFSKNAYGAYERGETPPSAETLMKLAAIFDVSLDYLMLGKEHQEGNCKSYEELIHLFAKNGISPPGFLQVEKWSAVKKDDMKMTANQFDWTLELANRRKR